MTENRRQFLTAATLAATSASLGLTSCGGHTSSGGQGNASLLYQWWGNPTVDKLLNKAVKAYTTANPKVSIKTSSGQFKAYWNKIAVEVSGHNAPDVMQMSWAYVLQYAHNDTLLDLTKYVDTSKFAKGTLSNGKVDGKLVAISLGINAAAIITNPKLFEAAKVEIPDDKTWTWDDLKNTAAELTAKSHSGIYGLGSLFSNQYTLSAWLRQRNKSLFTADGKLGFAADDAAEYFMMALDFEKAKAVPPPSVLGQNQNVGVAQKPFNQGKRGMIMNFTSQLGPFSALTGSTLKLLRYPSMTGHARDRKAWYKPAEMMSASSRTKYPEAAGKFIDWCVNSTKCASILGDTIGVPANTELIKTIMPNLDKAGKAEVQFLKDIKPELSGSVADQPPGASVLVDSLQRNSLQVLFGKETPKHAGATLVADVTQSLKQHQQ